MFVVDLMTCVKSWYVWFGWMLLAIVCGIGLVVLVWLVCVCLWVVFLFGCFGLAVVRAVAWSFCCWLVGEFGFLALGCCVDSIACGLF